MGIFCLVVLTYICEIQKISTNQQFNENISFTSNDAAIATAVMNSLTSGGLKYLNPLNNGAITTATVLKFTNQ